MIPYVSWVSFQVGPLTVYVWGMFVALGITAGLLVAAARARRWGLDPVHVWRVGTWVIIGGILGARLWYLLEYGWELGFTLRLVRVQDGGLSATGAVLGGLAAAVWVARRRHVPLAALLRAAAPGILLGEAIGRLGCFFIHDHLGRPTSFPLSVIVAGVQRHEVGLELSLVALLGFIVYTFLERRVGAWLLGKEGVFVLLWYSGTRFLLDFLRATDLPIVDPRYGGLTLAQFAAIVGLGIGSALLLKRGRARGES